MMALASVSHFEQYDANKWLVEIEVGGLICQRRKVIAHTLPEVLAGILAAYREMATPEMLEAQGMAEPPDLCSPVIRANAEEDLRAANAERMARVRAAKAAKHQKEATAC